MLEPSLPQVNPELPAEVIAAAARGWKLFPIAIGTKKDALTKWGRGGPDEVATSDIAQLERWSSRHRGCNWGCATGAKSGFFVLDTDNADGWMWAMGKGLPATRTVKTGKDDPFAYHYYFKMPEGMRIKTSGGELAPGADVRGDGGMVLIPPSLHPSGNRYAVTEEVEIADAPQWLLSLVVDESVPRPPVDLTALEPLTDDQKRLGLALLKKKCGKYAEVPAGQWNTELTSLTYMAGSMVAAGVLTEAEAEAMMLEIPTVATYMEEEPRTVKGNFASGFAKGAESPWDGAETEAYLLDRAGFGLAPIPKGASLVPLPPVAAGVITMTPEERMLANLATQHSIALIFARRLNEKMLYDHTRKVWMEFDGTRWAVDELKKVHNFILNIASEMNTQNKASLVTYGFCDGVERHLRGFPEFSRTSKDFDQDHYLLNTPVGTLDLRTGKMGAHDPRDMITLCTDAAPDAASDGAAFREFMKQITNNDEELIRFHQVSLGACLSGAVEGHWLLFWYGVPRAGKNTLGELVEALMGDYARTIPTSTLMSKKFEGHPTEMANLQGIRLATSSELSDGDHWNEARIKQLTGDATLSARWIGGNFFEFPREFKLLVYGNYKPQLRSADEALRARLKIVPFKVSFLDREDTDLPRRLRAEMGYVLQWLIDGHQQWLAAGKKLPRCAAVEAEISQYFEGQSTPKLWMKECCEIVTGDERPDLQLHSVVELYRSYRNWKEARGESPLSQTRWQPEALSGFETVRTRRGACVRRLRLLPLQHSAVPFPPASPAGETFEEFAARVSVN